MTKNEFTSSRESDCWDSVALTVGRTRTADRPFRTSVSPVRDTAMDNGGWHAPLASLIVLASGGDATRSCLGHFELHAHGAHCSLSRRGGSRDRLREHAGSRRLQNEGGRRSRSGLVIRVKLGEAHASHHHVRGGQVRESSVRAQLSHCERARLPSMDHAPCERHPLSASPSAHPSGRRGDPRRPVVARASKSLSLAQGSRHQPTGAWAQ